MSYRAGLCSLPLSRHCPPRPWACRPWQHGRQGHLSSWPCPRASLMALDRMGGVSQAPPTDLGPLLCSHLHVPVYMLSSQGLGCLYSMSKQSSHLESQLYFHINSLNLQFLGTHPKKSIVVMGVSFIVCSNQGVLLLVLPVWFCGFEPKLWWAEPKDPGTLLPNWAGSQNLCVL